MKAVTKTNRGKNINQYELKPLKLKPKEIHRKIMKRPAEDRPILAGWFWWMLCELWDAPSLKPIKDLIDYRRVEGTREEEVQVFINFGFPEVEADFIVRSEECFSRTDVKKYKKAGQH